MPRSESDRQWQQLANSDPYWAVLSDERYRQAQLTPEARAEFFQSGERYVARLWQIIEEHWRKTFTPKRALDFGCGVGRLALPLARRCGQVIGVDVATSMLELGRQHAIEKGVSNIEWRQTLEHVTEPCDLVNSFIVLQHIPVDQGLPLLHQLLDRLTPDGMGAIHVIYASPKQPWRHRAWSRLMRFMSHAEMAMHAYPLDQVMQQLQSAGARRLHLELTNHGGHAGAMIFFQKSGEYAM